MRIDKDSLCVARVLHESDDFLTLEVPKRDDIALTLDPDGTDRFYTVIFLHMDGEGGARVWIPWQADDE